MGSFWSCCANSGTGLPRIRLEMSRENYNSRIAIVGASSLRGKELRQVIEESSFGASELVLLDTTLPPGTLAEAAGEPTFVRPMEAESFAGVRFAFFAGPSQEARANWRLAKHSGAETIDLTGALEEVGAAPWIPDLDTLLAPPEPDSPHVDEPGVYSSPFPPVMISCRLAAALARFSPARLAILFFPPASEHEQAGVDELESQTTDLLLLRPVSQPVFDAQVAFNLLAGYGSASHPSIAQMRSQIARGVARYLSGRIASPAIQLVQAPVFYGYAFAAYTEFPGSVSLATVDEALAAAGMHVTDKSEPKPTNVSIAGETKIHIARAESDPNVSSGVWLWGAADNLRLAAANALRIAEELLALKA